MTFSAAGGQYPCPKGCGGFGIHLCHDVNASFRPPSTTGYPESSGPCGRCGGPTYIGVTHSCATTPPMPMVPFEPRPWPREFHTAPPVPEPVRWKPKPCGKCTSEDARIYFHLGSNQTRDWDKPGCGRNDLAQTHGEHLHVYCQVCHFDWTESLPRKS